MRVTTFGTFDMFHIGHLRLLERAAALGSSLSVGLSTDEFSESKKSRLPVYDYEARRDLLLALRCVDSVFPETSLDRKREYLLAERADILVMGNDWVGRFDDLADLLSLIHI